MNDLTPSSDAVEIALEKVLSSASFRGRPQLRRLLAHLVQYSLAENGDPLKDTRLVSRCSTVASVSTRNATPLSGSRLSICERRCARYYRSEGATDPLTISVPKGGYRATFRVNEEPPAAILDDPERLCFQVEWSLLRGSAHDIARIQRHVQHAIVRWPGRSDLYVALASTALAALELESVSPVETIGLMRQAAHNALQCDPTRGDAEFYGTIHRIMRTHKDASIAAAYRWLDFAPNSALAHFWVGNTIAATGRMDDALVYLQKAARLQPYATCFETWFAVGLFWTGRPDAGLRHLRAILAFEPHDYLSNFWLGLLASHARRFDEAREAARRAYQVSRSTQALAASGDVEATSGSVEAAEAILDSLAHSDNSYVARSGVCQIYVALGRLDGAAREWGFARAEGDWELGWAAPDPRWNALRGKSWASEDHRRRR